MIRNCVGNFQRFLVTFGQFAWLCMCLHPLWNKSFLKTYSGMQKRGDIPNTRNAIFIPFPKKFTENWGWFYWISSFSCLIIILAFIQRFLRPTSAFLLVPYPFTTLNLFLLCYFHEKVLDFFRYQLLHWFVLWKLWRRRKN